MFMLVAAEQLRHLVRRPRAVPRAAKRDAFTGTDGPEKIKGKAKGKPVPHPIDPLAADAPAGTRYQLFRALRAMAAGESMVVEHKIPDQSHFETSNKRSEWFRLLSKTTSWEDQNDIEPVLVPGTPYPSVIGRILIRSGCCAPSEQPHWVPNLRLFFLTEVGRESLRRCQEWWLALTAFERMRLMLLE